MNMTEQRQSKRPVRDIAPRAEGWRAWLRAARHAPLIALIVTLAPLCSGGRTTSAADAAISAHPDAVTPFTATPGDDGSDARGGGAEGDDAGRGDDAQQDRGQSDDADAEDGTLTWSVRPTPREGQPNRSNFSFDVEEGQRVNDSIRVRNYTEQALPLSIYASDARTTETGAIDLLPADEDPADVGAWIALEESTIEVPPGEVVDVPFTMVVPQDAEPGDHAGGIVTSYASEATDASGEPVVLDRRLGNRVQVRVDRELRPELTISDLTAGFSGTPNPTGTGDMDVSYTVTNTGNVRLAAEQLVAAEGRFGFPGREVSLDPMPELLPGSSLSFTTQVPDVWPIFRTTTAVELDPVPVREGDDFGDIEPATASTATWTIPWPTLVLVVVVVGGPLSIWLLRRRRRRREEATVQKAVEAALAARGGSSGEGDDLSHAVRTLVDLVAHRNGTAAGSPTPEPANGDRSPAHTDDAGPANSDPANTDPAATDPIHTDATNASESVTTPTDEGDRP